MENSNFFGLGAASTAPGTKPGSGLPKTAQGRVRVKVKHQPHFQQYSSQNETLLRKKADGSGRSDQQHSNTDGFSFSVRLVQPNGKREAENHTLDAAPDSNLTSLEFAGFSGEAPVRGHLNMKSLQNSKSMI